MLLAGEWIPSMIFMSLAFLTAALGVIALGWYVLRGDRINRAHEGADEFEQAVDAATGHPGDRH